MQSLPVEVGSSSSSATQSGPEVQVVFPVAQTSVLDSLNQQREDGRLCDLSIHVQGHVFKAHRCVLAASSPYFHDQVLLKNMSSVSIPAVMDPLAFESVLRCAYTGQLRMLRDDIVNYLTVGSVLQMWHIVDKCTELLKDGRVASADRAGVGGSSENPGCSSSNGEGGAGRGSSCDQVVGSNQHQSAAQPSSRPAASESQSPSSTNYFSPRDGSSFAGSGTAGGRAAAEGGRPSNTPSYCTPSGGEEAFLIEEEEDEEDEEVLFQQKKRARGSAKRKKAASASEQVMGVSDSFGVSSYQGGEERSAVPQKRSTFSHPNIVPRKQWVMVKTEHPEDDDLIVVSGEEVGEEDDEEDEERDLDLAREKARDFNICNVRSLSGEPSDRAEPDLDSQLDYCPSSEDYLKFEGSLMDQALAQHIHDSATNQSASRAVTALLGQVQSAAGARAQLFPLDMQGNKILLYSQASGLPVDAAPPALEMSGGLIGGSPFKGPGLEHGAVHVSLQSAVAGECESSGVGGAGGSGSGKVFMCHCGKTFTHRSMRDRHINMHLDLRPFHCPVCAKKFKMKHHLTEHMKTHTGLKPYDCGSCGKKFMWRDSFMRHRSHCERRGGLVEAGDSGGGSSSDPGRAAGEEGAGLMPSPHHHLLSPGEGSSRGGLPLSSPLLTAQHAAPSGGNSAAISTGPIPVGSSTQGLFDSLGRSLCNPDNASANSSSTS
ncbi:zinc finger and BTB domain-containing protein 22b [Synchiropus splendidus]|uniref:zinc finger and BTB domain-containing protein 22b n=1 Tax=Synchiropus splendidus TaxID=270530 RepID=UPI00237DC74B|nr:zinc finger and BTB domain-containing protein 22b [Synchiropus splendidus]